MTDPAAGLQFDTAEPKSGSTQDVRCAACGDQLAMYFQVNAAIACRRCKDRVVAARGGSHLPALVKATALGLVAAAGGSALYYGVAVLTGYEIGLISIVVGLLVGFAVRKGSRARGGWRYQALAMFLTYLAIASTYVPRVLAEMAKHERPAAAAPAGGAPVAPSPGEGPRTAEIAKPPAATEPAPGAGNLLVAIAMLLAFTLALPFLAGFDNLMGLFIIAIGLYEAWKVNRAPPFSVTGPYTVGVSGTNVA